MEISKGGLYADIKSILEQARGMPLGRLIFQW
jgi:hypothetical protein